ncbi:uncharacterized protein [Drosophila kikkawai]|uniref:Membrane-associated progesterone receptor component 1 n=1 Tax=Drosophila kikkawai TaxID=30033 RepID=A0A6P4IHA5_DROKI|nr:uncharacterized protein LOC108074554 [Drosophila kikkawai]
MSSVPIRNWINLLRDLATSPAAIIVVCGFVAYVAYTKTRRRFVTYDDIDYKNEGHVQQPIPLKGLRLTRKQLAKFNSNRADKKYLVALNDLIYDVSSGATDFGPDGKYAELPGTEISNYVKKESRLEGREYELCLNEWRMKLDDFFYPAGKLVADAATKMDSVPEEIEDINEEEQPDLDLLDEEGDVELGIAGSSKHNISVSSEKDTSSEGDSNRITYEGFPDRDDRDEVDSEEEGQGDYDRNNVTLIPVP